MNYDILLAAAVTRVVRHHRRDPKLTKMIETAEARAMGAVVSESTRRQLHPSAANIDRVVYWCIYACVGDSATDAHNLAELLYEATKDGSMTADLYLAMECVQPPTKVAATADMKRLAREIRGSRKVVKCQKCIDNKKRRQGSNTAMSYPVVISCDVCRNQEEYTHPGHYDQTLIGILADMYEDTGADDSLLLHLRNSGPHYLGCKGVHACLQT